MFDGDAGNPFWVAEHADSRSDDAMEHGGTSDDGDFYPDGYSEGNNDTTWVQEDSQSNFDDSEGEGDAGQPFVDSDDEDTRNDIDTLANHVEHMSVAQGRSWSSDASVIEDPRARWLEQNAVPKDLPTIKSLFEFVADPVQFTTIPADQEYHVWNVAASALNSNVNEKVKLFIVDMYYLHSFG